MEISFKQKYLEELYYDGKCNDKKHRFQPQIVKKYIRVVDILKAAPSVEALYGLHGLNYEVLSGDKKHIESVRVNNQYRIEFQTTKIMGEIVVTVCDILELSNHYS